MTMIDALKAVKAAVEEARREAGLVEITLDDPTTEVVETLKAAGATWLRREYDEWCNNSTCHHNSHDSGQSSEVWLAPAAWVEQGKDAGGLYELGLDDRYDQRALALVPPVEGEQFPVLLYREQNEHWAAVTRLATLPIAEEAEKLAV